jgi:hypothetical protein
MFPVNPRQQPQPQPPPEPTPEPAQEVEFIDETWPWPHFPRGAKRNFRRHYHEEFTGWEGDFLHHFREHGIIRHAAKAAGVTNSLIMVRRQKSPEFRQAFLEAKDEAADNLEAAILKRAREGVKKTKEVYERQKNKDGREELVLIKREESTEYSDTLAIFIMKGLRPEVYRDAVDHNHRIQWMHEEARRLAAQEGLDPDMVIAEAEKLMGLKK